MAPSRAEIASARAGEVERPGGDDAGARKRRHFAAHHADVGVGRDLRVRGARKGLPVDRQCRPARHPRLVGAGEQEASERAQLGLEQSVRILELDGLEGVGADQLGEAVGLVRGRLHVRPHLVQGHLDAPLGERPGRLTAGQATPDDGRRLHVAAAFFFLERPAPRRPRGDEARLAASSSIASGAVNAAGSLPRGSDALTSPCFT